MTSRVSSKNKEKKKAKGKIVLKKKRPNREQKRRYKETENSIAGSRTRFICMCQKLLDQCTTVSERHDLKN